MMYVYRNEQSMIFKENQIGGHFTSLLEPPPLHRWHTNHSLSKFSPQHHDSAKEVCDNSSMHHQKLKNSQITVYIIEHRGPRTKPRTSQIGTGTQEKRYHLVTVGLIVDKPLINMKL